MHRGQTETGAATQLLGGEERFEHARQGGLVHAHTRVGHFEPHVGSIWGGADAQSSAVRHGVARVEHQVHEHLFDLALVRADPAAAVAAPQHEVDVLAHQLAQHGLHACQQPAEVDRAWVSGLASREREQASRQGARLLRCHQGLAQMARCWRVGRHVEPHQLHIALDRREQVVEVVRDAAGQPAHALESLRLHELRLEPAPHGEVLELP